MARKRKFVGEDETDYVSKEKKPFYKRWWFWLIAIIIVIGALGGGDEENTDVAGTNDSSSESQVSSESEILNTVETDSSEPEDTPEVIEETYDNVFEKYAHEVFGDNLREFEYIENEGKILITTYVPGNITENLMKHSFHMLVIDYAEAVQNEDFVDFYVDGEASMTDQYGNTEDSKVFTIGLNKETVDKINFDDFITDNLEDIADAVFVHPSFLD